MKLLCFIDPNQWTETKEEYCEMNIITCIDIELTTEDVKKIIAEFINKKFGTTINTDQNNIDIPCFDHATVNCRFSTETIQVDKERGLIRR